MTNSYITIDSTTANTGQFSIYAQANSEDVDLFVKKQNEMEPEIYFYYIKGKFGTLENMKINARLKRLEKAFNQAVDNEQFALSEKLLKECMREARETFMVAKGIKHFIEDRDLKKHKMNIRGGHISDTRFQDYTKVIPKEVLKKKKAVNSLFDGFVIYHYWNEESEAKREKKEKISPEEKARMRDPVLFGVIKESNRLYFIAEWDDEYCDLSFEEMIDVIGLSNDEVTIPRNPNLRG